MARPTRPLEPRHWRGPAANRIHARDLMTANPESISANTTLIEAARRMRDLEVGALPVTSERGVLIGVITDRDLVVRAAAEGWRMEEARVGECMSRPAASVAPSAPVREILRIMKRHRVRRLPVIDARGELVGIIALADLAVHYAQLDEARALEVEELLERISEPARPRSLGGRGARFARQARERGSGREAPDPARGMRPE